MKKKIIGLILLLIIMAAVGVIYLLKGNAPETVTVNGYVGGEKSNFWKTLKSSPSFRIDTA